jgi:hypothetical protein
VAPFNAIIIHILCVGENSMRLLLRISLALTAASWAPLCHAATCTVPNSISNGQVADASQVMGDLNAIASCVNNLDAATIKTTGTITTGAVTVFSGQNTLTSGNLSEPDPKLS